MQEDLTRHVSEIITNSSVLYDLNVNLNVSVISLAKPSHYSVLLYSVGSVFTWE